MKNNVVKCIALGAAAVLVTGALSACAMDISPLFPEYENAELYSAGNFTYQAADVSEVEIDWIAGEVNIVQSAEETLSVSEKRVAKTADKQVHYYLDGAVLRIKFCASDFKGSINEAEKKLTVEIPSGIYLEINSVSSPVDLGSAELSGVAVTSTSGSVLADTLTAATASIETVSGNVEVGMLCVNGVSVETVSGHIEASIPRAITADFESVSGNVKLRLAEGLGTNLRLSVVSGKFNTELAYTQRGSSFSFYGGGSNNLHVDLVSGNLTVS